MTERFLPGVPGDKIMELLKKAPGKEHERLDSPRSSAALAVNVFGYFLSRPKELPELPGCPDVRWPADSLTVEKELRLPWRGGTHPHLDVVVTTPTTLIGIESKRFEPFDGKGNKVKKVSETYWNKEAELWGKQMRGYARVRDQLRDNRGSLYSLDAAQLFKHALGLRTAVQNGGAYAGLTPILFYIYAEPAQWPDSGQPVATAAVEQHREELAAFAKEVANDEVKFAACSYRELLESWVGQGTAAVSRHAAQALVRFAP